MVDTLDAALRLVAEHPGLSAVTTEGDRLGAAFAHGGSGAAPSLLETRAAVDEAARAIAELDVRCAESAERLSELTERRRESAAAVEQLALRRRQLERERAEVAGTLGRLGGQSRPPPARPNG